MASYGQRTSGQLLLSYGFAPTAGENPHDACLLQLSISEQDPLRVAKIQALQKYGLGGSQVPLPSAVLDASYDSQDPGPAKVRAGGISGAPPICCSGCVV